MQQDVSLQQQQQRSMEHQQHRPSLFPNPVTVCAPNTIDLTAPTVTAGSDNGLNFTFWTDANATTALANPNALAAGGLLYQGHFSIRLQHNKTSTCNNKYRTSTLLLSLLIRQRSANPAQWISQIRTSPQVVTMD